METFSIAVYLAFLVPGLFIVLIPSSPALSYMFLVSALYAFLDSFKHISSHELLVLLGISLFSIIVDYTSGALGAKYGGATLKSMFIGIIGALTGVLIFPPLGGLVGLFLGVFISELIRFKNERSALKAAGGAVAGALVGMAVNAVLALTFFVTALSFVW